MTVESFQLSPPPPGATIPNGVNPYPDYGIPITCQPGDVLIASGNLKLTGGRAGVRAQSSSANLVSELVSPNVAGIANIYARLQIETAGVYLVRFAVEGPAEAVLSPLNSLMVSRFQAPDKSDPSAPTQAKDSEVVSFNVATTQTVTREPTGGPNVTLTREADRSGLLARYTARIDGRALPVVYSLASACEAIETAIPCAGLAVSTVMLLRWEMQCAVLGIKTQDGESEAAERLFASRGFA